MKSALIGILTFTALISPLSAESSEAIRIAIIPGEGDRAPKAGIVDLLTAELSKRDDIVSRTEDIRSQPSSYELLVGRLNTKKSILERIDLMAGIFEQALESAA